MKVDLEKHEVRWIKKQIKESIKSTKTTLALGKLFELESKLNNLNLAVVRGSSLCPFCGGTKTTPFVRYGKSQDCKECDKHGKISNRKLTDMGLIDFIENYP